MPELLRKGAEANLYLEGRKLVKERVVKKYRLPEFDRRIRKNRTSREARILEKALDAGVRVPKVFKADERSFSITMEYVEGSTLKDVFESDGGSIKTLSKEVGVMLRRLHDNGLVHNDLTTSNLILHEGKVYFIDFGLAFHSQRLEDKAMDLVVFKKSILATHTGKSGLIWEATLEGYKPEKELLDRIRVIEKRVRYAGGG
ncbi:MAG: KEOPS complex kinase/ATPase Bud32 [Candidatus Altiarchaeota archaeon]|nr:KEOPS complex kinase/ATPase Bud32 [Candidatus Altiarchaeota archaeon]